MKKKYITKIINIILVILIITTVMVSLNAQDYDKLEKRKELGRSIMEKVEDKPTPEKLESYTELIIVNGNPKNAKIKKFNSFAKEYENSQTKTLVEYLYPSTTMKILRFSYEEKEDDVWIKTAGGDVTAIAMGEKSTKKFMGSHVTYEDLESRNLDDYIFIYAGVEKLKIDGKIANCAKIEARKKDTSNTAYSKSMFYVRDDHVVVQAKLYDKNNKHIKTMKVLELEEFKGKDTYTIVTKMAMKREDMKDQYSLMEMSKIKVDANANVDESKLRKSYLEKN